MYLLNATHLVECYINVTTIKIFDNLPNITHLHLLSNLLRNTTDDDMDKMSSMLSSATENILRMMQITRGNGNVVFDPNIIRKGASASIYVVKEIAKTTFNSLFPLHQVITVIVCIATILLLIFTVFIFIKCCLARKKRRARKKIIQKLDQLLSNRKNAHIEPNNVLELLNYRRRDIDMV